MNVLTPAKRNRDLTFWSLQAMGWSALFISHYLGSLVHSMPSRYIKALALVTLAGFILTAPLRYVCRWLWQQPPMILFPGALLTAYCTSLAWRVVVNYVYGLNDAYWIREWTDYFGGAVSGTYLMTCWVGLYFGFRYYESMQTQRAVALRASALAQESQLKMLRYQLNPHFLFNTLNAISTLILDNRNNVANSAVTGLSEFLRYTLDQDPMKKITVAQEIDALNLYLNIEKMRFGPRLTIRYCIDESATSALMPSLLLQPLIENAIKYAVAPREEGGTITIAGRVSAGTLHLIVSDDGPGMSEQTRSGDRRGVGIRNTRERLQVLYGERGQIDLSNASPGLKVTLMFPAERAGEEVEKSRAPVQGLPNLQSLKSV